MLLNILRIPPGVSLRKQYGNSNSGKGDMVNEMVRRNYLIKTYLKMAASDVCIGAEPFVLSFQEDAGDEFIERLGIIKKGFDRISQWVALDLLRDGVSVYQAKSVKNNTKFYLRPLNQPLQFFLNDEGDVMVYDMQEEKVLDNENLVVFINYNKDACQETKDSNIDAIPEGADLAITPVSMQLDGIEDLAKDLYITQKSIVRYRAQLSRIVRFVTVDVGVAQGDKMQNTIDNISESINSDSMSLLQSVDETSSYDDNIPVIPTRKDVGKPELQTDIPEADISKLADLDNLKSDLSTVMRMPKTYTNFDEALGSTAASMVRGDVRYQRLITSVQTLIESTVNDYLQRTDKCKDYDVKLTLTKYPSSEDSDVLAAVSDYKDFLSDCVDLFLENAHSKADANNKVQLFQDLLGDSANLKSIQKFIEDLRDAIEQANFEDDDSDTEDAVDMESPGSEGGLGEESGGEESGGTEENQESEETSDFLNDVETIPEGTEQ